MKYIEQPKGPGTAYRFRMKTPKGLLGTPNPWSQGKSFGTWIIRPMEGERHLPTAKKIRDMFLAEVRKLEVTYRARKRYSPEKAEMWAEALRDEHEDESFIRSLIYDEAEKAPESERKAFLKIATSDTLPLSRATPQYLEARAPGNPYGNKPLSHSTSNEVKTAVNYLCAFFERTPDTLFLDDVTPDKVAEFWHEFLPTRPSKKNPGSGLSPDTVAKLISGLRSLWKWAIARKKVRLDANPFKPPEDDIPRAKKPHEPKREPFKPEETQKVLSAVTQGDRMGDLFRIGLVTGARVSELAKVTVEETKEDGSVFLIAGGKSENAKRVVPVPKVAQPIIQRLRAAALEGEHDRLFHAFPINAATGTAKSASKAFTGLRRKVFGRETDERLAFHSLRRTWKTISRRAGLSIDDAHNLGGWAGVKRTSNPYDHGLNDNELAEAQEKVAGLLSREGYLEGF
ncbi:tyrosine-type recombinase/integrase [Pseudooceanicola nitratireducens]|uniref:tyrosine-type recombinase/integrase n=1 Tax=Pseudooceanicola nitratireducens TaxID=517719 RepID=UPI001C97C2D0|nr:tyrosine-type recombinase/integrase [Pseudooceanicola nitratireducens]MBY6156138.1 site-specific integrase [Pseudooceanicola nitratireducens]